MNGLRGDSFKRIQILAQYLDGGTLRNNTTDVVAINNPGAVNTVLTQEQHYIQKRVVVGADCDEGGTASLL